VYAVSECWLRRHTYEDEHGGREGFGGSRGGSSSEAKGKAPPWREREGLDLRAHPLHSVTAGHGQA
jgi:hypothetical protein